MENVRKYFLLERVFDQDSIYKHKDMTGQVNSLHPRLYNPCIADQYRNQYFHHQYIVRMHALSTLGDTYLASKVTSDALSLIALMPKMISQILIA